MCSAKESNFDLVKEYLSNYSNVHLYKGFFPATSTPVKDKRFAFVNLDVDIYQSTLDSLAFFYPRMNTGGAPGVIKAFEEFMQDKPEAYFNLSESQLLIVKN